MYIYIYIYTPDGELIITTLYTHMYTHTQISCLFYRQATIRYTYIYIYILFHHTELSICFTAQIAHHHAYIYIYIYTLFHHTELTSVWLPRLLSFTTLGKPTIWMVTYLSPSYTRICTHTYTVCFTDSPTSYIYIYIYSVSPHRVNICFTIQMAQFNHTGETNNLDGDLSITILYTHMYTHAHTHIPVVLQIAHHHIHIYIHTHVLCFTAQSEVSVLPHR